MPAAGVDARQQRVQTLLFELPLDPLRDGAAAQLGHRSPLASACAVAASGCGAAPQLPLRLAIAVPGQCAVSRRRYQAQALHPAAGERFLQRREPAGFEVEQGGAVGLAVFILHRRLQCIEQQYLAAAGR
jgi:hypothetical protein